jgi:hypothetical protein
MLLNFEILANTSTLAQMFFASTIFITLAIARYATLAKLIRDSRADIENKKINFNNAEEYIFHIEHYEKRLKLLKIILYLSLFGGVALCLTFFLILIHYDFLGMYTFGLYLFLIVFALFILVYELAVSFEALKEHLDMMKSWKDKIQF